VFDHRNISAIALVYLGGGIMLMMQQFTLVQLPGIIVIGNPMNRIIIGIQLIGKNIELLVVSNSTTVSILCYQGDYQKCDLVITYKASVYYVESHAIWVDSSQFDPETLLQFGWKKEKIAQRDLPISRRIGESLFFSPPDAFIAIKGKALFKFSKSVRDLRVLNELEKIIERAIEFGKNLADLEFLQDECTDEIELQNKIKKKVEDLMQELYKIKEGEEK
jgi:hypothetical protein